jgi:hypothetical protein
VTFHNDGSQPESGHWHLRPALVRDASATHSVAALCLFATHSVSLVHLQRSASALQYRIQHSRAGQCPSTSWLVPHQLGSYDRFHSAQSTCSTCSASQHAQHLLHFPSMRDGVSAWRRFSLQTPVCHCTNSTSRTLHNCAAPAALCALRYDLFLRVPTLSTATVLHRHRQPCFRVFVRTIRMHCPALMHCGPDR